MNTAQLNALRDSILLWEEKLAEDDPNLILMGVNACPLCRLNLLRLENGCAECPVRLAAGRPSCRGTPYTEAYIALREWRYDYNHYGENDETSGEYWRSECQREIDFLKSLLPPAK